MSFCSCWLANIPILFLRRASAPQRIDDSCSVAYFIGYPSENKKLFLVVRAVRILTEVNARSSDNVSLLTLFKSLCYLWGAKNKGLAIYPVRNSFLPLAPLWLYHRRCAAI